MTTVWIWQVASVKDKLLKETTVRSQWREVEPSLLAAGHHWGNEATLGSINIHSTCKTDRINELLILMNVTMPVIPTMQVMPIMQHCMPSLWRTDKLMFGRRTLAQNSTAVASTITHWDCNRLSFSHSLTLSLFLCVCVCVCVCFETLTSSWSPMGSA